MRDLRGPCLIPTVPQTCDHGPRGTCEPAPPGVSEPAAGAVTSQGSAARRPRRPRGSGHSWRREHPSPLRDPDGGPHQRSDPAQNPSAAPPCPSPPTSCPPPRGGYPQLPPHSTPSEANLERIDPAPTSRRDPAREPRRLLRTHCLHLRGDRLGGRSGQHLALPGRGLRERWWRLHPALPGGPADRGHPAAVPGLRDRASLARLGTGFLAALPPLDGVHRLVAGAHLRDHRLLLRADPGLGAELHGVLGRRALGR